MEFVIALLTFLCVLPALADVDLSGSWRVKGRGEGAFEFEGRAQLPGTLAQAHLGKRWTEDDFRTTMDLPQSEALAQEWQFAGKAVWTRPVDLTAADCGAPAELFLERVMWTSAAFWDDKPLGTCDSLATPHVYALPKLTPGRHVLRLEIDNGNHYGFSRQSHAYGPNMQAVWNGVLGKVLIRPAHPLRAARIFAPYPARGVLRIAVRGETGDFVATVLDDAGRSIGGGVVAPRADGTDKMRIVALTEEPKPWRNEPNPALYTLVLKDVASGFTQRLRFGFRSLGTRDHALTLNGEKIFSRGNVENANFAKAGTPWMTKAEWAQMFKTLRDEDGIDTIRFHTWCPPAAAFEAAEELGLFLQPEAGIWTDKWMSSGDEVGNGKRVDDFVRRELKAIVDAYGNSPAFLSLSIGNELGNSNFAKMGEMIAALRAYDPRALYYASSARDLSGADDFLLSHKVLAKGLAREKLFPRTDWDYEDIYAAAKVPVVAHEIGQWPVYPIWDDLLKPFTGVMRPWNLSRHRDTAAKKGALALQREYHAASAKLNRLIYKEEVESFLRTPSCAGLQLLNVQDYTGQAEALVGWRGPFYDLKAGFRDLPKFATVWGPISYLARFPKFTYVVGETFRAQLQIRNLTHAALPAGKSFDWRFAGASHRVTLPAAVAPGEIGDVASVEIPLTDAMTASKQTLFFGSNRWDFWVYPREGKCALPPGVVMTADMAEMKAAMAQGGTVLYTGPSWKSAKGHFKSVYWSARWFPVANTTAAALGTWFDVAHPAFRGFVTEDFTDWQWYSLAEGATIHALRDVPPNFRPIALSVNDFHFSDRTATLFEVLVGRGRLFVCGYDIEAATPEARRLRASICTYLAGAPAPNTLRRSPEWLNAEFGELKTPDLSGAVYDCRTNWVGRTFRLDICGVPPTTGEVIIDGHQPLDGLTSGRGLLDGRVFEVPFTEARGAKTVTRIPVIREDFLDGRLTLEIHLMTGAALGVDRIRIVPKSSSAPTELSLGRPFTDGAVLQRRKKLPVWGRATPGEVVTVSFAGQRKTTTVSSDGNWRVSLDPLEASKEPREMTITAQPPQPSQPLNSLNPLNLSTSQLRVRDILVGEVWLCAGQSNMALPLVDPMHTRLRDGIGAMVAQVTDEPLVRYLATPVPKDGWQAFTPTFLSFGSRSAIAVHYALELHAKLDVPVGVVVAATGGCNIDAYLPSIKSASDLDGYFLKDVYPYTIRGAVWYQGETNIYIGEVEAYGPKMRLLYDRWRTMFENPALSFYYVQLAPFARGGDYDAQFPRFLAVQASFEKSEPHAAMTVINDLGSVCDIHPNEKELVAKRLALHAFKRDYGFLQIEDCSPEPVRACAESNVVTVAFDHAKQLYAYQRGQPFSPDLPFELCGTDGVWRPARILNFLTGKAMCEGQITNHVVTLVASGVTVPTAVRYAWRKPWIGSLYNEVNLPLGTFAREVLREGVITNGMTLVRSSCDGTLQPCYVALPKSRRTRVPLLVGLHSWSGSVEWTHPRDTLARMAAERGWAFVYPHFRGCNDRPEAGGSEAAVRDILDAVAWMKAHAQIDADRIYAAGGSGGAHAALLVAARAPETFAAVAAFCPITDLARWHADGLRLRNEYPAMLEGVCGGVPAVRASEYAHRSPLSWLKPDARQPVFYIAAGIHDGHGDQSVPPGHSIRAFNALARPADRISESDIAYIDANEKAPPQLAFKGVDPFYPVDRRVHLRQTSARARLTLFDAGHRDNYPAAIDFLARQRRGAPPDWTVPSAVSDGRTSQNITR